MIAFKVHLDTMHVSEEFYADRRTRAVVLERDRLQNFCSNFWAYSHADSGHTPSAHKTKGLVRPPCTPANVEKDGAYFRKSGSWKGAKGNYAAYDALITPKFNAIRRHLNERNAATAQRWSCRLKNILLMLQLQTESFGNLLVFCRRRTTGVQFALTRGVLMNCGLSHCRKLKLPSVGQSNKLSLRR